MKNATKLKKKNIKEYARNKVWEHLQKIQNEIAPEWPGVHLPDDDYMIIGCVHMPNPHLLWIQRMLAIAKMEKIRKLIIAGDLFDLEILSYWTALANKESISQSLEKEFSFAEEVLKEIEKQFDKIYILPGNHQERILQALKQSITNKRLLGLVNRGNDNRYEYIENYDWLIIGEDKLRVTHLRRRGGNDLTQAKKIAAKTHTPVGAAGSHRYSEGTAADGITPVIQIGAMMDMQRAGYKIKVDSANDDWTPSFLIYYKNGKYCSRTEHNYNWKKIGL